MRNKILFLLVLFGLSLLACDYVAPNTSKAITEKQQQVEFKKQNNLLEEQNKILLRIAVALENKK